MTLQNCFACFSCTAVTQPAEGVAFDPFETATLASKHLRIDYGQSVRETSLSRTDFTDMEHFTVLQFMHMLFFTILSQFWEQQTKLHWGSSVVMSPCDPTISVCIELNTKNWLKCKVLRFVQQKFFFNFFQTRNRLKLFEVKRSKM